MLIGELGQAVGLPSQTIRFYERQGLLPQPSRAANGYRVYDESTITRVEFIRAAQAAGLTLVDIRGILDLRDDGHVPCTHVAKLIDGKLADVRRRIRELAILATELQNSSTEASGSTPPTALTRTSATFSRRLRPLRPREAPPRSPSSTAGR